MRDCRFVFVCCEREREVRTDYYALYRTKTFESLRTASLDNCSFLFVFLQTSSPCHPPRAFEWPLSVYECMCTWETHYLYGIKNNFPGFTEGPFKNDIHRGKGFEKLRFCHDKHTNLSRSLCKRERLCVSVIVFLWVCLFLCVRESLCVNVGVSVSSCP